MRVLGIRLSGQCTPTDVIIDFVSSIELSGLLAKLFPFKLYVNFLLANFELFYRNSDEMFDPKYY